MVEYVDYIMRLDINRRIFDSSKVYYRPVKLPGVSPIDIHTVSTLSIDFVSEQ